MTVIAIKEWPDGHPWKNGTIGFVKRRITSSENQSPVAKQIVTLKEQEDGTQPQSQNNRSHLSYKGGMA
jgi:hypothetical protein